MAKDTKKTKAADPSPRAAPADPTETLHWQSDFDRLSPNSGLAIDARVDRSGPQTVLEVTVTDHSLNAGGVAATITSLTPEKGWVPIPQPDKSAPGGKTGSDSEFTAVGRFRIETHSDSDFLRADVTFGPPRFRKHEEGFVFALDPQPDAAGQTAPEAPVAAAAVAVVETRHWQSGNRCSSPNAGIEIAARIERDVRLPSMEVTITDFSCRQDGVSAKVGPLTVGHGWVPIPQPERPAQTGESGPDPDFTVTGRLKIESGTTGAFLRASLSFGRPPENWTERGYLFSLARNPAMMEPGIVTEP
ncbi:MAG: hypothetical protein LJE68_08230 [Rhodobacter sp.]|nr:hypothetical protein [Rhodobacter sp.]